MYIYIFIYIYMCIYIFIYIYGIDLTDIDIVSHTQMQKIYYCLLNAQMWTKDVHIDKRDRTHKIKTHTYTHARTHAHTHTLCLLIYVFAPLAFGYVCTVIMISTFRKSLLLLWFSSALLPNPPKNVCMSSCQI